MRIVLPEFVLALLLVGCATSPPPKRYAMEGEIKNLDPISQTATISAGKIGDWMEAMTMEYPVKPEADFDKLRVGDRIQATVVVDSLKYFITDVTVESKQ
jgi:Cu/Ag efflux protein CusF